MMSDWADHLTTLFPEARIKNYLEVRGADGGTWRRICGLPALWAGIFYDQSALNKHFKRCYGITPRQLARAAAA